MKSSISYDEAINRMAADDQAVDRYRSAAAALEKLLQEPWSPPDHLTKEVLLAFEDKPVLSLSEAINLMAFGNSKGPDGLDPCEIGARRCQAAPALLGDPARNGDVGFIGSCGIGSDRSDPISPHYFHLPRTLGDTDNSLSRDFHALFGSQVSDDDAAKVVDAEFLSYLDGKDERWFNVRVDGPTFFKWLRKRIGSSEEVQASDVILNAVDSEKCWTSGRRSRSQRNLGSRILGPRSVIGLSKTYTPRVKYHISQWQALHVS